MTSSGTRETMRPSDIFLYLIGNRRAIHRIAATPWAWLVGAVLVLSAGLARNYDHLDLLRQPSWFIGPFAASLISTVFIFAWITPALKLATENEISKNQLAFLNLVWLTAPCAWIYGIPVELFTGIITATKWNIAFLAFVSLWRVALIIRAVTVLTEAPWLRVSLFIIAPAALEMMVASYFKGLSIIGIMGGVRLPPEDRLLLQATSFAGTASFWTFCVSVVAMFFIKGTAKQPLHRQPSGFPRAALILAIVPLVIWIFIALPFQPAIQNRYHLIQLIQQKEYEAAITFASSKERKDFPAIHYLAPEPTAYVFNYPLEPLEKLPADAPAWLREEWTNNAIEAHKSGYGIDPEKILLLRAKHPDVYAGLLDYESTLLSKSALTREESYWLSEFQNSIHPEPTETE